MDVATDSGFGSFVAGYSNLDVGNVTEWDVTGLLPGKTYYYRVRAYFTGNVTENSNIISVITVGGKMARNSWYLSPEGWILRAYTNPLAINEVYLEMLDTGGALVDAANISGMAANPLLIASDAAVPEVSLGFDKVTRAAFVVYTSGSGRQVLTVTGVKEKPQIQVIPEPVVFGNVTTGTVKKKTLTVTNTGGTAVNLISIGKPGLPFSITTASTCSSGMNLTAGGSCTVVVKFAPSSLKTFNESFVISSDGGDVTVHLSGTGVK